MIKQTKNPSKNLESAKPFLRWAGGKTWLTYQLDNYLPANGFKTYHEVFTGGGAVFFHLKPSSSFLGDANHELINTYEVVANDVNVLINILQSYKNTKENYYRIRSSKPTNPLEKAARFIFLNQTSFNGIYRVNLKGEYNVPYGYRKKNFLDEEVLRNASKCLKNANFYFGDFMCSLRNIKKGDLVFLDPPYTVAHNNNGFVKYNQKIFSIEDQYRLADYINTVKEIGASYILTNAAHKRIREIFNNGDNQYMLTRASTVGGKKARRGVYSEMLITNIEK